VDCGFVSQIRQDFLAHAVHGQVLHGLFGVFPFFEYNETVPRFPVPLHAFDTSKRVENFGKMINSEKIECSVVVGN